MASPLTFLTKKLGINAQEITLASVIIGGLLVGAVLRFTLKEPSPLAGEDISRAEIESLLDSIAAADRQAVEQQLQREYLASQEQTAALPVAKAAVEPKNRPQGRVDLNTATKTQLMAIPGIGEKMAETIIEHRKLFPFARPEDIMRIKGIGEGKYRKIQPYITVRQPSQ